MEHKEHYYCEHCKKETEHIIEETALELITTCVTCGEKIENYKTFF